MDLIVSNTNIRRTLPLEKYLGFPMHGWLKMRDYEFLEEKMTQRLAFWQNKLLNKAGGVTLVKSVLNSIPTYYMQLGWLPQTTCNFTDQIRCLQILFGKEIQTLVFTLLAGIKLLDPRNWAALVLKMQGRLILSCWGSLFWTYTRTQISCGCKF